MWIYFEPFIARSNGKVKIVSNEVELLTNAQSFVALHIHLNITADHEFIALPSNSSRVFFSELIHFVSSDPGYSEADGKFTVEDSLFYECGPQQPLPELSVSPLLVLISGLDQSSTKDFTLSLELFQQWLYGNVASAHDSADHEAANVVRVIVAGNSVRTTMEMRQRTMLMRQPESVLTLKAVNDVDELMRAWSKSVNVDLMPGEFDPSNLMLPQQPFHPCMFPKSSPCGAFRSVSNPYECSIEDRLVLGTSGQNISNIQKYSNIDDSMDALRSIARWGHVAPTSPDTLPCYPYTEQDPFIIRDCPHILFAGNCSTYQTDVFAGDDDKRIRLVCVPRFSQTQSVAVVNLRTLECKQLCFHIDDFDEVDQ